MLDLGLRGREHLVAFDTGMLAGSRSRTGSMSGVATSGQSRPRRDNMTDHSRDGWLFFHDFQVAAHGVILRGTRGRLLHHRQHQGPVAVGRHQQLSRGLVLGVCVDHELGCCLI